MPQAARNKQELYAMFRSPIMTAINYVVDKIWNENRELVRVIVYEAYQPKEYNRTGEFRDAWVRGTTKALSANTSRGEFKYDPNEMSVGSVDYGAPNYAQHIGVGPGKPGKNKDNKNDHTFYGEDARPYLADIIYGATKWGGYFGDNFPKKRDVWTELNKRIGKRKMKQWMKEGLEYAGLTVQAHNVPINVTVTKED